MKKGLRTKAIRTNEASGKMKISQTADSPII